MVKLIKKIRQIGNSYYIPVDKSYITNKLVKLGQDYEITAEEINTTPEDSQENNNEISIEELFDSSD